MSDRALSPRRQLLVRLHVANQDARAPVHHVLAEGAEVAAQRGLEFLDVALDLRGGDALGVSLAGREQKERLGDALPKGLHLGRGDLEAARVVERLEFDAVRVPDQDVPVDRARQPVLEAAGDGAGADHDEVAAGPGAGTNGLLLESDSGSTSFLLLESDTDSTSVLLLENA